MLLFPPNPDLNQVAIVNGRTFKWDGYRWQNVGDTGYKGSEGYQGSQGEAGYQGSVGFQGSQGQTGYSGSIGYTGSQGFRGYTGYAGSIGASGYVGSRGDFGQTGSAFEYKQNTLSGPSTGYIYFDNANISSASSLTFNEQDLNHNNIKDLLSSLFNNNLSSGTIIIRDREDPTSYCILRASGQASVSYWTGGLENYYIITLNITYISGVNTHFNNIKTLEISIVKDGYTGSIGFTGSVGAGYVGSQGDVGYSGSSGYTGSIGAGYVGSRGDTGFSGSRGPSGPIGYAGSTGTGYDGSQGDLGYSGSLGYTGSTGAGYVGSQGDTGYLGSYGYTGSIGYTGSQGDTGYIGSRGDLGYTGSIGFTGSYGPTGYVGSYGDLGYSGSIGYTGSTGAGYVGSRGVGGPLGYTGSTGAGYDGSQGVTGYVGSLGYTGSVGDVGFTGSQGPQGFRGVPGVFGGVTYLYHYSANTDNSNPGIGGIRFDNKPLFDGVNLPVASKMYINKLDLAERYSWNSLLTIFTGSSTIRGFITFNSSANTNMFANYNIIVDLNGVTEHEAWAEVPIGFLVSAQDTLPDDTIIQVTLARAGDIGDTGFTGSAGSAGGAGYTGSRGQGDTGYNGSVGYVGSRGSLGYTGSAGLIYVGAWSDTTIYSVREVVYYQGASYVSLTDSNQNYPPDQYPEYWGLIAKSAGYTGSQGGTGYSGSTGDLGYSGSRGYLGSVGYTGSRGLAGRIGNAFEYRQVLDTISLGTGRFYAGTGGISFATQMEFDAKDLNLVSSNNLLTSIYDNDQSRGVLILTDRDNPSSYAIFTVQGFALPYVDSYLNNLVRIFVTFQSTSLSSGANFDPSTVIEAVFVSEGPLGYTGSTGAGYDGSAGYTGSVGIGYTGSVGAGFTGSQGDRGDKGYSGSRGFSGTDGYTGSRGDTGFAGSQGSTGIANVEVTPNVPAGHYEGKLWLDSDTGILSIYYEEENVWLGITAGGPPGYAGSKGDPGGYTGSRGADGTNGTNGYNGTVGYTGSRGSNGANGPIGFTGSAGLQGDVGYAGSGGIAGYNGSLGYSGSIGYTGSTGAGYTGSAGYVGLDGFTGSVGYSGSQGAGYVGSSGYTGSLGYSGSAGYIGSTGYLGSVGYTGSGGTGYTGSQGSGYVGSAGFTGSQGFVAAIYGSSFLNGTVTANLNTPVSTGVYIDLPASGTYAINYNLYAIGSGTVPHGRMYLADQFFALISNTERKIPPSQSNICVGDGFHIINVASPTRIYLYVECTNGSSLTVQSGTYGRTGMYYNFIGN